MVSVNVQSRFFRLSVLVMLVLSSWLPQPMLAHADSAVRSLPDNAVNADDLLQFQSGGHVLGFLPHQVYLAGLDHALHVEFVVAAGVRPQTAAAETFSQVTYPNLWPGINLVYTPAAGGLAKSTYTLAPGADPADIRLRYHTPLTQQADGSLRFSFGSGYLVEAAPVAWQEVDGRRVEVDVSFDLIQSPAGEAPLVGFRLGRYDPRYPLVIDPLYLWHTFYGSSDADFGCGMAVDSSGNVYVVGASGDTWNGPAGQAPLHAHSRTTYAYSDIVVVKLNSSGAYQWHTFYGVDGSGDAAYAIALDSSDGLYLAGESSSSWTGPAGQAPLHPFTGSGSIYSNLMVLKLNSSGAYQWHTFYGTGTFRDTGSDIAVNGNEVYIAGYTYGTWNGPANVAPLHAYSGGRDLVVLKLNSSGAYQWHTFYGSSGGTDSGEALTVDSSGGVFVVGYSGAAWTGPAGESPKYAYSGGNDILVLKLNSSGTYRWHTFYGGSGDDISYGIAVDGSSNVYLTGYSAATWSGPANQAPLRTYSGGNDIDVVKMTGADPDLAVQGNSVEIANGDTTPDLTDYTD